MKAEKSAVLELTGDAPTVHFGELMELCHEKHSELPPDQRGYKGRVVFRGDQVKDEQGYWAVFNEQGASVTHLSAGTILDAIARMPGCDGGDADEASGLLPNLEGRRPTRRPLKYNLRSIKMKT